MRIALIIGHHKKSKGAYSKHLKTTEYDFYNKVVSNITYVCDVYRFDADIKGFTKRNKKLARIVNKEYYDLVIHLHFNSFKNATGSLCLYYQGNETTKAISKECSRLFSDRLSIKNQGARALATSKDRGFASLYYFKADAILIEPFFGSNKNDCKYVTSESIACIIDEFLVNL